MTRRSMTRSRCALCAVALGAMAAAATAQEKIHDALAPARDKARAENQRVLLLLAGGNEEIDQALSAAMADYQVLGKLLRYECQVAALPADSLAGKALRESLQLEELALPTLAILTTDDDVLGSLGAAQMVDDGGEFSAKRVSGLVKRNTCSPLDARAVLDRGIETAKKSKRHAFVYLSAPW